LPKEIVDRMVDEGFFRLLLPRSLGGPSCCRRSMCESSEALARIDASAAWCLNQNPAAR